MRGAMICCFGFLLCTAGCAQVRPAATGAAPNAEVTATARISGTPGQPEPAPPAPTPPAVPAPPAQQSGPVASGKPATQATAPKVKQVDATKSKAPVAKRPAQAGAPAVSSAGAVAAPATPAASLPPPAVQVPAARPAAPAAPALDLTSLQQRLRETHAIGVFTKLSLKNQVDDLLAQLKAFHRRQSQLTLADLRQRYDLLLLKVLSLLQDGDPPLAVAISSSREAIWGILSDPDKFARMQLG